MGVIKESRIVKTEPNSNLIVKIVNNTNVLSSTDSKPSLSSSKIMGNSKIPSATSFDASWLHTASNSQEKSERVSTNLYESFLKSASQRVEEAERLDVELSKLSLDNGTLPTKSSNHHVVEHVTGFKASSNSSNRPANHHRSHHRPAGQHKWFRHKRANRSKDEFEFPSANEFWEDEEFLLNIGGEENNIKTLDSDGHDV